jgi:recombination protein RecA
MGKSNHLADRLGAAMKRPVASSAATAASLGVEVIPTGSLALDLALGIGGWPCGRVIEVFGGASLGKSTLALTGLGIAQRLGFEALYVDVEKAVDFVYAEALGVDLDALAIAQPAGGEEALEVALEACKLGARYIVIDSVAALTPKAEIEGGMFKMTMGAQARLMSQGLRSLITAASDAKAVLLFINQTRNKIGVVYGNPTTTTGGTALGFYSSIRLDLRSNGKLEAPGKNQVGIKVKGIVSKNKLAPPLGSGVWEILWGAGIDPGSDHVVAGLEYGVLTKRGNAIYLDENRLGASLSKACDAVREDAAVRETIDQRARAVVEKRRAEGVRVFERSDPTQTDEDLDLSVDYDMLED